MEVAREYQNNLGEVELLRTLCSSTTPALYGSPIQPICALLFHPLLWSLSRSPLVVCAVVLFVLFSGKGTHTVTNSRARCIQSRQRKFHNNPGMMGY